MKVTYRKARYRKGARYLIRCNCGYDGCQLCGTSLKIYPPPVDDPEDEWWEINGVLDSKRRWIELFTKIGLLP